jgi:hypothetical protein
MLCSTGFLFETSVTLSAVKKVLAVGNKSAVFRMESYRLCALYYWLINKQKKAYKWFDKSIKEGERMEARLDLSRTYFEVCKRLLEPQSQYKQLNGISAEEYLEKARILFEEMDLKWDLEQLSKLKAGIDTSIN